PRVGEARDTAVSHYVFEAPVRLWHWLTVACMLVLMVTGYFIGHHHHLLAMADCSSVDDGLACQRLGADIIGTTMSGYTTPDTPE
ncbi:cytochrome b/b6 domain-containing protein, partial [Salmonella enterica subsp. enterica serovar Anatum]|nr:cytochrome b/b6 domain-containing protein [Salmonella enterica subsp. enterica serovar Anatum]